MTSPRKKRVAVIGAGSAGLIALKSLLEDGHDACAFEQASDIGGLWNYGATGARLFLRKLKFQTAIYTVDDVFLTTLCTSALGLFRR